MRIRIRHQTVYRYEVPPAGVIQILRLTPRNHEGQSVVDWRIDLTADSRLSHHEDAFGNIVHTFTAEGPLSETAVQVEGDVETQDTSGIIRGGVERFPPSLFLRETALTVPNAAIRDFAHTVTPSAGRLANGDVLKVLHGLLDRLHSRIPATAEPPRRSAVEPKSATQALAQPSGESGDLAHLFIAAARSLGIPARYVAGYFQDLEAGADQGADHAWAEAYVPGLGWVGFDPANGVCPTDAYVRVAVALDYQGAAPVRGNHYGGGSEAHGVAITIGPIGQAGQQAQE
jgi:transglutaminase-like putative cysteine protease